MENKLHVQNLTISFRTNEGKVQAVRDISFDLEKGETLAIVGESGSGKSVTSKAILGILVENGEILYDGQDLLKISEEDFHKIRGDKIAMIFQDPMSSLNPISRIGRQLTEAMLLKGKARQRESRSSFNRYLLRLQEAINATTPAANGTQKCKDFDRFEYKHLALEAAYNTAHEAAEEALADMEALSFELSKNAARDLRYRVKTVCRQARASVQTYVVHAKAQELQQTVLQIEEQAKSYRKGTDCASLCAALDRAAAILREALGYPMPNFFAMGYYVTYCTEPLPDLPVEELNKFLRKYLDDHFMLDFIATAKAALMASAAKVTENKKAAMVLLAEQRGCFEKEVPDKAELLSALKVMADKVNACIDPLAIVKDGMSYTFKVGLSAEISQYFDAVARNKKEEARYRRQTEKAQAAAAKSGKPVAAVAEMALLDTEEIRTGMLHQIDRLIDRYGKDVETFAQRDFDAETVAVIDYLKDCASGVVHRVTRSMAKHRAIKLMEEVGISEPRKRYRQYPFEFSGCMRQRIVIAIALAANPDILICDEPTTALDVTIQSQILELINKLKAERHLSVIFITHDLGVVANMADRVAVMYAGKIVEYGTAEDIFYRSAHPYTWALLSSMPDLDTNDKLDAIPGTPPNMIYPPKGDAFAERNKYALQIDFEQQPPMFRISDTHYAATWLLHPDAPKVEMPKIIQDRIAKMKEKREAQQHGEQ